MHEQIEFMIDGIGPRTILSPKEYNNADSLQHLGYLIFISLRECWRCTMPKTRPFPPQLACYTTRYEIMNFISTKKVRIQTPDNIPNIHNILGVVLSTFGPTATILRDAFTEICITNTHSLQLFGAYNNFTIDLLAFPTNPQERITIGRTINQHNHQYHRSQFKLMPNIRIHPHFLKQHNFLTTAILNLDNCLALFCGFSHGHGDLHLTGIFTASHLTNFSYPGNIQSKIVTLLANILDLTPSTPHTLPPATPPHQLPIQPHATTPGCGRGRGRGPTNPYTNSNKHVQIPDRSLGHQRSPQCNILNLNLTPSKQFHAIINAAGGIATAGIYQANFDHSGLRHLTAGVSFSIFQKFQTWAKAFNYTKHFYPHIKTKEDIT
jgi:hypothetical protein